MMVLYYICVCETTSVFFSFVFELNFRWELCLFYLLSFMFVFSSVTNNKKMMRRFFYENFLYKRRRRRRGFMIQKKRRSKLIIDYFLMRIDVESFFVGFLRFSFGNGVMN